MLSSTIFNFPPCREEAGPARLPECPISISTISHPYAPGRTASPHSEPRGIWLCCFRPFSWSAKHAIENAAPAAVRVLATTLRIEPILGRVAHAQTASVRLCIARLVNVFLACAQFRTRILSSGPRRPYALTLGPGKASWAQAPPEAGPEVPSGLPCCYSSPWYSWFARDSVLEWAV
jgi:hypothetical protein